jgi:hypothetical protein
MRFSVPDLLKAGSSWRAELLVFWPMDRNTWYMILAKKESFYFISTQLHEKNPTTSNGNTFWLERWKCDDSTHLLPLTSALGDPPVQDNLNCRWAWVVTWALIGDLAAFPCPKVVASASQAAGTHLGGGVKAGAACWWCSCHILLVHGWVSPGTEGMSIIDRNCIIKLDRILTLSWHAIYSSHRKPLGSRSHGIWSSKV